MKRHRYTKSRDNLVTFAQLLNGTKFFARVNQQEVCYEKHGNRGILVPNQEVTNVMQDHPFSDTEFIGLRTGAV